MTRAADPRPPRLPRLPLPGLLLLPLLLIPATAGADYTASHQWSGGSLSADRQSGASTYPARGTLVSMTTSPTRARLSVKITTPSCYVRTTASGTVAPQPGAVGDHLLPSVDATGTIRQRGARGRVTVSLRPTAPGVLRGTVAATGTYRDGRRVRRCSVRSTVQLRSRASLAAPLQPLPTDPALPRMGVLSGAISPRVRAAFLLTRRRDGQHHAMWSSRQRCRSNTRRTSADVVNFTPRFRIRADGTFRGRERIRTEGRTKEGRYTYRFDGLIVGRIDPDGVARGTVTGTSRTRQTGYYETVCRTGRQTFAAAP